MNSFTEKKTETKNGDLNISIFNAAPVGIITFSADWKIEFVSKNAINLGSLYNIELSDILGNNILKTDLIPDISLTEDLLALRDCIPFEKEIRNLKTAGNASISVYVKATPLFENNSFKGGILVIEDISISAEASLESEFKAQAFEKLFARIDDILLISDSKGQVIFSSGKNLDKMSVDRNSPPFHISKIVKPDQAELLEEFLNEIIIKRTSKQLTLELTPGDSVFYFDCRIEPFINTQGRVQFIFFLFRDITKLYQERKSLIAQINRLDHFRMINDNINDSVFVLDQDGKIILWNESSERIFGYSEAEVIDHFVGSALSLFNEEYFDNIKQELSHTEEWIVNLNIFRKSGEKVVLRISFTIPDENREVIIVSASDITEQADAEKKLKQSEEKFRNIVTQAAELICSLSPDGTISFANQSFVNSLKYSATELIGKNFIDLIDSDYKKANVIDSSIFERSKSKDFELQLLTKKGYPLYVLANFNAVYSENNVLSSYNGYFTDITDKKSSEKDLMIFQSLFEASQDGIAVECEGRIIVANESFANIFGYGQPVQLAGKEVLDLVSNSDTLRVAEYLKIIEEKKQIPGRLECLGRRLDGSNFYIEVSVATFESDKKIYIVLITRDITERKRAQQVIRESEEKYRNITENIDDFLYSFERLGKGFRPTFYTSSVEKVTGYSQAEFLSDTKLLLKIVHPDDFPLVKKRLKNILRSRIQLSEEIEFRIINKHGNVVWVRNKLNLTRNSDSRVLRIYGLVSDITLRKKAEEELKHSTENLIKLNETKDKFISIVSHDLRTPFTSILGFTDLLLGDETLTDEEKKQYVRFIKDSSYSMLQFVNSLLDWTRLQTGRVRFEPDKTDIREVIEGSINTLGGAAFHKNITISSTINDELAVFIDKNLVLQAFNNLITNAIKFTNIGGHITISATAGKGGRFVEFSIKDDGVGILPENMELLFKVEAKFTSPGTAGERGSGLGLSLVKEIIEKHGGKIWAESVYGKGTEFKFLLPVASANILLVDDNKTDRLLYTKILKSITPDYNIDIAANGKEALEKITASPPALVITDHLMPEMTGYDLVNALRRSDIKGKPPVIVLSSELDRATISDYNEIGIEYVFSKPVNLSSFKQAVEKTLKKGLRGN